VREFLLNVPKSDLHVHLDGSVRVDTLIDLAKKQNMKLPSETVDGLNEVLFKDNYKDLGEYLTCFGFTCPVMQTPENLERIAYEFAVDNQRENVCYVEVRFAPQLHINEKMDLTRVLQSVNDGLDRAAKEYNQTPEVKSGQKPKFVYGIIACAMRSFGKFSDYYAKFLEAHPFSDDIRIFDLASFELVQGVCKVRDEKGIPIVAFDLAGQEDGFPAADHWKAYQFAHENFMHKTVHAGEAYGPESIFQAITELHADRIGHGYYLFDESKITSEKIKNKKAYVKELSEYIADSRVTIEVCLTSNLQTNPSIKKIENHQFKKMLEAKLSTTFCTDNRTVSKTTVTEETLKAIKAFNIDTGLFKDLLSYGFKRSFFPGDYKDKRKYVRSILNRYEQLEREFKDRGEKTP
jgi:adenosine deaminase